MNPTVEEWDEAWLNGGPVARENTIRVDFTRLPRDMCAYEIHHFVSDGLQVQPADLLRLQWNRIARCMFLKMRDRTTAERLVGEHSGRHRYPFGAVRLPILLSLEDASVDVVLYDLSELVDNELVSSCMGQYGWVVSVAHHMWSCGLRFSGIDSGQRIVRMIVRHPIPPVVEIGGELTKVSYQGVQIERPNVCQRVLLALERFLRSFQSYCLHD